MTPVNSGALDVPSIDFEADRPWSNWSQQVTSVPGFTVYPTSERQVGEAIHFAIANDLPVRPVGTGHSWTPLCATPGVMVDLRNMKGVRVVDRARKRVAVKAGTTVWELGEALWEEGFSLKNQGDIDVQTIAGAMSTGTHGSGAQLGILASSVRGVRLVDGQGNLVEITEDQPQRLKAAQVSLGLLGVITEVVLEVVDRYYLEEEVTYPSWQDLLTHWDTDVANTHHWSWFWFPYVGSAALWGVPVPAGQNMADRAHLRRITTTEGPARRISTERRVDRNYRIYHGDAIEPYNEMEVFVPATEAQEAVTRIRSLVHDRMPQQQYPVQPRWVKADDAYLSPAYKVDSVGISIGGDIGTSHVEFFQTVERLLEDLGARMHWGKVHFLTRERIERLFPEFQIFQDVRRDLDPNNILLNDSTRPLFG